MDLDFSLFFFPIVENILVLCYNKKKHKYNIFLYGNKSSSTSF